MCSTAETAFDPHNTQYDFSDSSFQLSVIVTMYGSTSMTAFSACELRRIQSFCNLIINILCDEIDLGNDYNYHKSVRLEHWQRNCPGWAAFFFFSLPGYILTPAVNLTTFQSFLCRYVFVFFDFFLAPLSHSM